MVGSYGVLSAQEIMESSNSTVRRVERGKTLCFPLEVGRGYKWDRRSGDGYRYIAGR